MYSIMAGGDENQSRIKKWKRMKWAGGALAVKEGCSQRAVSPGRPEGSEEGACEYLGRGRWPRTGAATAEALSWECGK